MRKLLKVVLVVALLGLLLVIGGLVGAWRATASEPTWYEQARTAVHDEASAARLERTLAEAQNAVAEPRAAEPVTLRLAEADVNALLGKWSGHSAIRAIERQVESPAVRFADGEAIIGGRVRSRDTVVTLHLTPTGDGGFELSSVRAGRLPLPRAVLAGQLEDAAAKLRAELPELAEAAVAEGAGGVNDEAAALIAARAGLALLDGAATEPVAVVRTTRGWRAMRLDSLAAEAGVLAVTMTPMTDDEAAAAVEDAAAWAREQTPVSGG